MGSGAGGKDLRFQVVWGSLVQGPKNMVLMGADDRQ